MTKLVRDALGSPVPQSVEGNGEIVVRATGDTTGIDFGKTKLLRDMLGSPIPNQIFDVEHGKWVIDESGGSGGGGTVDSLPWSNITNKPTSFPPQAHTHEIDNIEGLEDALNGKASSEDLTILDDKVNQHLAQDTVHARVITAKLVTDAAATYPINRSTFYLIPTSSGYTDWLTTMGLSGTSYYVMVSTDKTTSTNGAQTAVVFTIGGTTGKLHGVYYRNALGGGGWSQFTRLLTPSDLIDATKSAKGLMQVGNGLEVTNGIVDAHCIFDNTKSLDTLYTDFKVGLTLTNLPTITSDADYRKYTQLINDLLGLDLDITTRYPFRYVLKTLKTSFGAGIQTIEVFSANFKATQQFLISRGSHSGSWGDWRINAVEFYTNGNPNGVETAVKGAICRDLNTGVLYFKTTGTTTTSNTGWIAVGGGASA